MANVNVGVASIIKIISWDLSACFCDYSKYLKSIVDSLVIVRNEINVMNSVSANVTSALSINNDDKNVRYEMGCYILHTFLLVTIFIFMPLFPIITQNTGQNKKKWHINKIKMKNNELKKVGIKNCTCYHFDGITKTEDFDFDNILFDVKSHENILIYDFLHKNLIDAKPLHIMLDKIDGFLRDYDGTKY